ncbi:MAG: glycosyltransferase family 4 protein [Gomphosphaeria aponina SAG 52.96 = DSM 107014]|uniref:Glycosyltransferase family 4 protein n=1 Tax=Gomphosphaeria aponina SAG 52.96 = DSM 107014 TaxID=1521640 RepID=A0A941JTL0_9CHRO|nr:glycosyltransferase family 4 protein [Gomphosphaeria aponina SAG 52.96 = DSM 107014]
MRILIYSYNYHPEMIGIAPLMTDLAEGLVKRGHQVRVVTAMPWYPADKINQEYRGKLYLTEEINGVKIQRCYVWIRKKRSFVNRILFELSFVSLSFCQALLGWTPDVILLTVPGLSVSVPAAILGWLYHCPIVLNVQDILPDAAVHVGLLTNKKLIRIFQYLEKFAYTQATKISVITEGFINNLLAKGVNPEKIVAIPNWVDVNFIRPLPQADNYFRIEHQLADKFVVLYAGNIALTQGLETLIEAATYLRHLQEIAIVIVGEKQALANLKLQCEEYGADNVTLVPFQTRKQLPEMLAAANIGLVLQKRNVIGFNMPSKIQVWLASGRPLIASVPLTGTAAEVTEKSGGGLVVPPEAPEKLAASIEELYFNPPKIKLLAAQGRKYAELNYNFESALAKYEQVFSSIVKNHPKGNQSK